MCAQQGQAEAPIVVQADTEPRQVRSRWTEQLEPLIISSNLSPSQAEGEEEEGEEEEDFHPQSLESLLGEEVEEDEEEEEEDGEEEKEVSILTDRLIVDGIRQISIYTSRQTLLKKDGGILQQQLNFVFLQVRVKQVQIIFTKNKTKNCSLQQEGSVSHICPEWALLLTNRSVKDLW